MSNRPRELPRAGEHSRARLDGLERLLIWLRRTLPGPFELLSERRHPLVRAEARRTRKWRWVATAFCVLPPLAVLKLVPLADFETNEALAKAILVLTAAFVCFWPLVMFTAAALASAAAVLAERAQDTAGQIVLTGVPKRALAAAKVLPHVLPFLLGSLAALPLYMTVGASGPFLADGAVPTPLIVWPLRMLAAFGMPWYLRVELTTAGGAVGVVMALTDLGAVWMAAHWGAGLAVRLGSLPRVGWRLAKQLGVTAVVYGVYAAAGFATFMTSGLACLVVSNDHAVVVVAAGLTLACAVFLFLWWVYPLGDAAFTTLEDFAWFDWLAMDEFDPRRRERGLPMWQDWKDVSARP